MSSRVAGLLAVLLAVVGAQSLAAAPLPARERQKRCAAEWRGLSAADKTAKGPTWPQFYSRCVKRLKDPKA